MTRILNGCAEARTVGTHYSTTHPPPLSQNSTSSYRSFSFSPPSASTSVPRVSFSLLHIPGPLAPTSLGGWFFRLAPPSVPLTAPLSLFLSAHPARHGEAVFVHTAHVLVALVCLSHVYTYTRARARAHGTHSCSILFSFHLSFYPTLFLRRSLSLCLSLSSSSSSSSFLREA